MALEGKVVYIAGSGIIGSACVKEFIKAGAKVWITSRDWNRLEEIKNSLTHSEQKSLGLQVGKLTSDLECEKIRDHILAHDKRVDHVVVALGITWTKGVLSEQSIEEFDTLVHDIIYSNFIVYKTFAKVLAKQSNSTSFTFVTSGCGENCEKGVSMYANASIYNLCDMCIYGMYNAAYAEFEKHNYLSINQLRIFCKVMPITDEMSNQTQNELGNDLIAKMIVLIVEKNLRGVFRIENRQKYLKEILRINEFENDIDSEN